MRRLAVGLLTALALGVAVTLVLGIYPSPLLKLADQAALFLH